mmetsp:Transcript_33786/g.77943  ORF Transcript_33786/g.77943 Transcript_33786/m.77943 type:complete len:273 (-) Transcript_33786:94-912(-)
MFHHPTRRCAFASLPVWCALSRSPQPLTPRHGQKKNYDRRGTRYVPWFFPTRSLSLFHHHHVHSRQSVSSFFFQESEIESFSRDRKRTVRALRKVDGDLMSLNHNKYCIRGLESYQSGRFNRALRRQRQSVISGVLEQQSLQRSCGVVNPVALSQIATRQSQWAKRWAMELASIDERERYTSIFDDHDDLLLDQIRECKRRKRIMEKREGETASIASSSNSSASTTTSLSTFGSTPSSEDDSTTCRDNTTRILNEALNVKVVQVEEIPSNRY